MKLIKNIINILYKQRKEKEVDLASKKIKEILENSKAKELEERVDKYINKTKNAKGSIDKQEQQKQKKLSRYSTFTQKMIDKSKQRSEELGKE